MRTLLQHSYLPFKKGVLQLHSKQKTLKMPKSRLFHLKQRMQQIKVGHLNMEAWAAQRVIGVEEQQLSCMTDLSAIKIEEMSEQQLMNFIPRFILEVKKKIAKNTYLTACIKWSVGYKGKSNLFIQPHLY